MNTISIEQLTPKHQRLARGKDKMDVSIVLLGDREKNSDIVKYHYVVNRIDGFKSERITQTGSLTSAEWKKSDPIAAIETMLVVDASLRGEFAKWTEDYVIYFMNEAQNDSNHASWMRDILPEDCEMKIYRPEQACFDGISVDITRNGESVFFLASPSYQEASAELKLWIAQGAVSNMPPCRNPNHPEACCATPGHFAWKVQEYGMDAALKASGLQKPPSVS